MPRLNPQISKPKTVMIRPNSFRRLATCLQTTGTTRTCWTQNGSGTRLFASTVGHLDTNTVADTCSLNIVSSAYPPLPESPYLPLAEFVTKDWAHNGGHLGDQIAILDGSTGLTRTFYDYHNTTCALAAALRYDMGIGEESTVAIFAPNHVDYLPVSLAVSLCGAKLTPINPLFTAKELEVILDRSRTSVLVVHESRLDVGLQVAKNLPALHHIVVITDDETSPVPEGTTGLASLKSHSHAFHTTVQSVHKNVETHPVLLPYSSGTTGLPKGVCLTHKNLVANLLQSEIVEGMGFPRDHKLISPLPFFHIYAYLVAMTYCAWQGQQLITMSGRFDLEVFCQLVEEHRPQRAHLVPPICLGLAKHPVVDNFDMSSLQQIVSAAAPMGSETEMAVKERLGLDIKQAWGMSELSPIGTFNSDFNGKSGSVGPLVSSTYGKIVDETGKSLPPYKSGELLIRGPQVMLGYLDAPDKTAECLSDSGWLRTGDVGHYDEDGYFYITDRLKELIKVKGYPVAPAELEAVLLTHDDIADCAVIQIPDESAGELPRAYVVLKDGRQVSEDEIKEWFKTQVAPYKRLGGGVVFTDSVPKSASGKILRRVLRDQVAEEFKQ